MPKAIQFSVEDLKTPTDLERVLRQFQAAITVASQSPATSPAPVSLSALANQVSQQLQLGGSSPLNLTGLLPSGSGALIEGTHAQRLASYATPSAANLLFLETDRNALYASETIAGAIVWVYVAGSYSSLLANQPTDLGARDAGFLFTSTDALTSTQYIWTGSAWVTTGGAVQKITVPSYQSSFAGTENPLSEGGTWSVVDSWGHLKKNNGVTAVSAATWSAAILLTPTVSANQYAQVTHTGALVAGDAVGVCTRLASAANGTGYLLIEINNTLALYIATDTLGVLSFFQLGSSVAVTPAGGTNTLRMETGGGTISAYYNGALILTNANPNLTVGQPGIAILNGGGNPVIASADAGSLGGNFYVGGDIHVVGQSILDGLTAIYGNLNIFATFSCNSFLCTGQILWQSGTNFLGTLNHANTVNRLYTFADANGNIVYETAALTNNNFLLGGGGALVKDSGFPVPTSGNGTLFTPTLTLGGGSTGMTGTFLGEYYLLGGLTLVYMNITLTNKGVSTGNAVIHGLPSTPSAVFGCRILYLGAVTGLTANPDVFNAGGTTTLTLVQVFGTGFSGAIADTNLTNGTQIIIGMIYI